MTSDTFNLRLSVYSHLGEFLGLLPDAEEITLKVGLNDVSTLSFKYPAAGVNASYLSTVGATADQLCEIAVMYQLTDPVWNEARCGRFLIQKGTIDLLDQTPDYVSVSVVSNATRLDDAIVMPASPVTDLNKGKRQFTDVHPATLLKTLWDEAVERGWGGDLDCNLSTQVSVDYGKAVTTEIQGGTTLRKVLDDLVAKQACMWYMDGRTFRLRPWTQGANGTNDESGTYGAYIGRDRTSVVLGLAHGTETAKDDFDWTTRNSRVIVEGEESQTWTFSNPWTSSTGASSVVWTSRQREKYVKASGVTTIEQARVVAQPYLWEGANRNESITRTYFCQTLTEAPLYRLLPGDWVRVERSFGTHSTATPYKHIFQIQAMTIAWSREEAATVDFTLGSIRSSIYERLLLASKTDENGTTVTGTGGSPSGYTPSTDSSDPANEPVVAPQTPSGIDGAVVRPAGTDPYIYIYWDAVTTDKADTEFATVGAVQYEVRYRFPNVESAVDGTPSWNTLSTENTNIEIRELILDQVAEVQVRSVFYYDEGFFGTHPQYFGRPKYSSWSDSKNFWVYRDKVAPAVPSAPLVNSAMLAVEITWDGNFADLSPMPLDFDHLGISLVISGKECVENYYTSMPEQRAISVSGLDPNEYIVQFRAYDKYGNVSDWSEPTLFDATSSIDADDIQDAVDAALKPYDDTIGKSVELANAMGVLQAETVKYGEVPPDEGVVDLTYWQAPDGKWWKLIAIPTAEETTEETTE